jgi:CRP-like cAMP-binding protein
VAERFGMRYDEMLTHHQLGRHGERLPFGHGIWWRLQVPSAIALSGCRCEGCADWDRTWGWLWCCGASDNLQQDRFVAPAAGYEEAAMQVRPEFTAFGVTDPSRLDPYLERRRFAQGQCLMRQGTAGGECYLIEDGEVRLEVERLDFDSHGVIAYLHAGMLCGEFSFLDGRPRSASAYAHTDVVASRLSAARLQQLCGNDPQTGLAVLRALGQDAAAKARQTSQHLEEFVFNEQIDPSVDRMVAAAAAAQAALAAWLEARVEVLLEQIAQAAAARPRSWQRRR